MIEIDADIVVIGAGFSGSLISMLLHRIGLRPILIDRGSHPRFAIGESSTPVTNLVLEDLARRYDLPRIAPLANYVRWKRTYPEIVCGLKRGFSYFHHEFDRDFRPNADHSNELLVAASVSVDDADTHWLRSDFDQFLALEAAALCVPYFDQTSISELIPRGTGWELRGETKQEPIVIRADVSVDRCLRAMDSFVAKQLWNSIPTRTACKPGRGVCFRTSRMSRDGPTCMRLGAGVSPIILTPVMMLRSTTFLTVAGCGFFDSITVSTSAGLLTGPRSISAGIGRTVQNQTNGPALMAAPDRGGRRKQFFQAKPIVPWRQTGRIHAAGLQSAASELGDAATNTRPGTFHDPFHSTGNTFTSGIGIDRLIEIFERCWRRPELYGELQRYDDLIQSGNGVCRSCRQWQLRGLSRVRANDCDVDVLLRHFDLVGGAATRRSHYSQASIS